jgi:hypothetical protein
VSQAWYEDLRESYRPPVVRILLIGESPPDPGEGPRRFFYAPTLSHDNLYRGVAEAFYGEEPDFDIKDKVGALQRLCRDGVWLIDAVEEPIDKHTTSARRRAITEAAPSLARRAAALSPTVGALVCHGVVFASAVPALRAAGIPVLHDKPLPCPLGNWRVDFVTGARQALTSAGWWA